jgi:hypothetical protein
MKPAEAPFAERYTIDGGLRGVSGAAATLLPRTPEPY